MYVKICNLNINYEVYGEGKDVILLHGWGANLQSFTPVINYLQNNFKLYAIDLPGFGKSEIPDHALGINEYANLIEHFIQIMSIKNPILIGHSFGGRIIIYLTGKMKFNAHKIILIDSAGIKPKRKFKNILKIYLFKTIKKILQLPLLKNKTQGLIERARKYFGSDDYKNTNGIMRDILVKVVNQDLRALLPNINAPTLVIWGEHDTATPISDGKVMEKLIPDAGLVILKNAGHFSYLDRINDFNIIIGNFLKKDMIKK